MRKQLSYKDEKLFLNFINSKPRYTPIDASYHEINGKFIRDADDCICFIHNNPTDSHGSFSDDPKAASHLFGYKYSWMFVEKLQSCMFDLSYLDEITLNIFKPLKKIKIL